MRHLIEPPEDPYYPHPDDYEIMTNREAGYDLPTVKYADRQSLMEQAAEVRTKLEALLKFTECRFEYEHLPGFFGSVFDLLEGLDVIVDNRNKLETRDERDQRVASGLVTWDEYRAIYANKTGKEL